MVTRSNRCGARVGAPVAVGGITTFLPAGVVTGLLCAVLIGVRWWFVFAFLPLWVLLSWLFWEGPRWVVAFRNRSRNCPRCGQRDWERPKYGGFGF
jgi:hypothetical protein